MDFNDRVLQLAEDKSIPLLERLKFCAIYESNLDEFFMVRVAGVHDKVVASLPASGADGDPSRARSSQRSASARSRSASGSSAASRTSCCRRSPSTGSGSSPTPRPPPSELAEIDVLFSSRVFPALTPLVFGVGRPFPYISNLSLSLLVVLRDPVQETEVLARVKVPKELLRRYLPIGDGTSFVSLEDVISHNLEALFPGMEVVEHALFRVTRDTDYDVSDEADDLRQAVEDEIRRRRFGEVIRLELEGELEPRLRERLVSLLDIGPEQVYEVNRIGMDDLFDIAGVSGFADLRYPPFAGVTQTRLQAPEGQTIDLLGGDPRGRHPRPPPLRLVHDLGRGVRPPGRQRPRRARDQADRVPDERRLAAGPGADPGLGARQAGGLHGGAEGALRRAGQHPLGEEARAGRRPRRLRHPRP